MGRRLKGTGAARKAALEQASLRDRAREAAAGEGAARRGGEGGGGGHAPSVVSSWHAASAWQLFGYVTPSPPHTG